MQLSDAVVVVTGAGSGIGAALCERFAAEAPRVITVVDIDRDAAGWTASKLAEQYPNVRFRAAPVDVSLEREIGALIDDVTEREGVIDLFCGNAGIGSAEGVEASDEVWRRVLDVNVMAHVYAARALLPMWLERGYGHMVITASAAGLLTNLGDAPYSVSKHGAVALAEWLSITYGDRGVAVSCLCPQGVRTPLLFPEVEQADGTMVPDLDPLALEVVKTQRILEPAEVAECVVTAVEEGRFLILPHEEVALYEQARAKDRSNWLASMRRMQADITGV